MKKTNKQKYLSLISAILLTTSGLAIGSEEKAAHWGYSGDEGPNHWGTIKGNELCSTGKKQSPIDIQGAAKAWLPPLNTHYSTRPTEVINNGHTIQVNIASGSTFNIQNQTFELKQFHFHSSSENRINGRSYPLEAHFVHADKKGHLAVIALMFNIGKENAGLADLWQKMPEKAGEKVALTGTFKQKFVELPKHSDYYSFMGSLTTPPCSEGVQWFVLSDTETLSREQVEKFKKVMGHPNNRPLQAINGRKILH